MEFEQIEQCRICLETTDDMVDLFGDSKTLYKLELCCGVEIPNNPSLPSKICKKCSDILKVAYGFRVLCQRSQEYLNDQQQNTIEQLESKQHTAQETLVQVNQVKTLPSPKLELEIEFSQREEEKFDDKKDTYVEVEDDHHHHEDDNFESTPEDECEDVYNKHEDEQNEDDEDDKPLIKFFPAKSARKPKPPITLMCNICGNLFKNKATFSYHMKLHRNDKKYECEICSKRFMQTCELRAHIRVHTGEKPYKCSYCDRKFRDRSGVTRHERTHTNERPYGCTICGANFSYSATLKKHERVHTGEKPFRCLVCDKGFSEAHQMKAHFGTIRHAEMAKERNKVDNLA